MKLKKALILVVLAFLGFGCSTTMNKKNSPEYRVMIDPESIDSGNYANLVSTLQDSNAFYIIDREKGFSAAMREQNMAHMAMKGRFDSKEKWALWKKLWGVGAVIVAKTKCQDRTGFWHATFYERCNQTLTAVDTSTGLVLASHTHVYEGDTADYKLPQDWTEVVEEFVKKMPKKVDDFEWEGRAKERSEVAQKFDDEIKESKRDLASE